MFLPHLFFILLHRSFSIRGAAAMHWHGSRITLRTQSWQSSAWSPVPSVMSSHQRHASVYRSPKHPPPPPPNQSTYVCLKAANHNLHTPVLNMHDTSASQNCWLAPMWLCLNFSRHEYPSNFSFTRSNVKPCIHGIWKLWFIHVPGALLCFCILIIVFTTLFVLYYLCYVTI